MSGKVKDMTTGSPGKLIMLFAIPLMIGSVFQQFYTMVDTMVVGQVVGVQALAALGAVEWIVWMVLGISTGMTQGFSILVSQFYGAQKETSLKKAVARSYVLTAILAVLVLLASQAGAYPLLKFLQTPSDIIELSSVYLRIALCGVPSIAAYNCLASVLRALGNSRSPLMAMIFAAGINVGLDLLFVAGFGWGVAGAAIATVIAQTFSALYCYLVVRKIELLHLTKENYQREAGMDGRLLCLGAPTAFQNIIISVGGMVVQYVVNGYGFLFVAGFTATNKLYGVLELAAISYGYAITTYVGQNLGANQIKRIKQGVRSGAVMAVLTSLAVTLIMVFAGKGILSLFISGEPKQVALVLDVAYQYLFLMAVCLWILYLLYVYRSAIQGLGNTVIPMISGVVEFIMRVGVALLLPLLIGSDGIFYAEICAWTGAAILLAVSYYKMIKVYR